MSLRLGNNYDSFLFKSVILLEKRSAKKAIGKVDTEQDWQRSPGKYYISIEKIFKKETFKFNFNSKFHQK